MLFISGLNSFAQEQSIAVNRKGKQRWFFLDSIILLLPVVVYFSLSFPIILHEH
ncbi:hypothetical protein C5167_006390 [Papaver somniferum]|uniref:Uncharacterized protein n=1 Tax=Papaver somniferum TaxID=3469 RepID=A0A4Y7JEY6_PAPSO|nr:hypothetical protein C5167_006390 [Papaver somniferum]